MENSLKNFLIWNYFLNLNQTLVKWSVGDPLSELCLMTQPANQDGHHNRSYFNIGPYGKVMKKVSRLELLAQF